MSTGSDSEGVDSDRPLLRVSERDVAVSYKPGGKGKQKRKKVNVLGSDCVTGCGLFIVSQQLAIQACAGSPNCSYNVHVLM